MEMNVLELKILGMLRRHRWGAFRLLSMSGLIRRSGGAFREVTIALINLEQASYIRWPDKTSLQHIVLLRSVSSAARQGEDKRREDDKQQTEQGDAEIETNLFAAAAHYGSGAQKGRKRE